MKTRDIVNRIAACLILLSVVAGVVLWQVWLYRRDWKHPEPWGDRLVITTKTTNWRGEDGKQYFTPGPIEVWRNGELEYFDERYVVIYVNEDGYLDIRYRD